jgi:hypothetical protein
MILRASSGGSFTVPLSWTDRAEPSPWETLKKIPPSLDALHLWELVELLEVLMAQKETEGHRET